MSTPKRVSLSKFEPEEIREEFNATHNRAEVICGKSKVRMYQRDDGSIGYLTERKMGKGEPLVISTGVFSTDTLSAFAFLSQLFPGVQKSKVKSCSIDVEHPLWGKLKGETNK